MLTLTITIADLDRLTHALLLAKVTYLIDAVDTSGEHWNEAKRNIDALQELYNQIEAAEIAQKVEA